VTRAGFFFGAGGLFWDPNPGGGGARVLGRRADPARCSRKQNLQKAFWRVLRHSFSVEDDCMIDDDSGRVTVLTDDERPRDLRRSRAQAAKAQVPRGTGKAKRLATHEAFSWNLSSYGYMVNCHVWCRALTGATAGISVMLPDAQGLVADRRCALALNRARVSPGAYMLGLRCGRRVSGTEGLPQPPCLAIRSHTRAARGCHHRHLIFGFRSSRWGLFMVSISPTTDQCADHRVGNCAGRSRPPDTNQLIIIGVVTLVVLSVIWK